MKKFIFLWFSISLSLASKSQVFQNGLDQIPAIETKNKTGEQDFSHATQGRINLFIFTRERKNKIDLLAFYTLLRAGVKSLFHHKKFYVINARSSKDATAKVEYILHKKNKLIKNLWFDSHGHYGNRYSSFRIGTDQFYYKNIHDTGATKYLQTLARYCDDKTKVGLGSCYAGADFYFPVTDSTPATRMNGDSLMIGLGDIFSRSVIYASESWVMAKPGIFTNKFGFAGYPLQKRFKDSVYAPVWQRIGKWRQYSKSDGELKNISTISLDRSGNIHTRYRDYNTFYKSRKEITKALKNLKPALAGF
ncbi:MAG: hypothetical protein ACRDE8_09955 [Ginsengibacter sp.]